MSFKGLEIGAGTKPHKPKKGGWIHQDIRDLAAIDVVCDCRDLGQFKDGEFDHVYASHVIEHVGWREAEATIHEWWRIVAPCGKLEIIVPDFPRLWHNYLSQRDIPATEGKWRGGPIDGRFVAYVTGGGQDYPENTHTNHHPPEWYREVLKGIGADVALAYHGKNSPSPSTRIIAIKPAAAKKGV